MSIFSRFSRPIRVLVAVAACGGLAIAQDQAPGQEPIAFVGHGAMFDAKGHEISPSLAFIRQAQAWYRAALLAKLNEKQRAAFDVTERKLTAGQKFDAQTQLIVDGALIDTLIHTVDPPDAARLMSKNDAMRLYLQYRLGDKLGAKPVRLDPKVAQILRQLRAGNKPITFLHTMNGGAAYRAECIANGVPAPPDIGNAQWISRGVIAKTDLFIAKSLDAEVFTYHSTAPEGMCIALPRFDSANTVQLDGVICVGKVSSKVCFWDNEKNGVTNTFQRGTAQTFANVFGGGTELLGTVGGVCSDCHAGENPYAIHGTVLSGLSGLGLPTFPDNWYDPIVRSGDTVPWPENPGPMNSSSSAVPTACSACHYKGYAGRFPHLSPDLPNYCSVVLALSVAGGTGVAATMPPGAPGSLANDPVVNTFRAWCGIPTTDGTTSDRGDPHIITFNDVHYDFQSAGEFTLMRGEDGMQVQTRQTPVGTSTIPLANDYTGLTSCVSLNTAFAAHIGTHRLTYEPNISGVPDPSGMQLRIDGVLTTVPAQGLNLSGGGRVANVADGIELFFPNGSHLLVTANWWGAPHNKWYLNVDVVTTTAREGLAGAVMPGNWLPLLPDGTPLGSKPANAHTRYVQLNQTFANAWRVSNATSLFDYKPGTSTASFTNAAWPVENATSCVIPKATEPPAKPMNPDRAKSLCADVADKAARADCVFDTTLLGDPVFARSYLISAKLKAAARAQDLRHEKDQAAPTPPKG